MSAEEKQGYIVNFFLLYLTQSKEGYLPTTLAIIKTLGCEKVLNV